MVEVCWRGVRDVAERPLGRASLDSHLEAAERQLVTLDEVARELEPRNSEGTEPDEGGHRRSSSADTSSRLPPRLTKSLPARSKVEGHRLLSALRQVMGKPREEPKDTSLAPVHEEERHWAFPESGEIAVEEVLVGPEIAVGMSGRLFKGLYRGQEVAVKLVKLGSSADEERALEKQFHREVRMLDKLRHRNVVELIGFKCRRHLRCVVMEYLSGGTLRMFLQGLSKPLPYDRVLSMALDIARGMEYLHSQGVVHRDLKSENLMFDGKGTLKIVDLGIAKFAEETGDMTAEAGTYRWMAPEVMDAKNYTSKVDVYSFGIVLWEILTQELPFDGMSPLQAAYAVTLKNARPHIPEGCPVKLRRIMQSCWLTDPTGRPNFHHVVRLLEDLQMQESILKSSVSHPIRASSGAMVCCGGEVS